MRISEHGCMFECARVPVHHVCVSADVNCAGLIRPLDFGVGREAGHPSSPQVRASGASQGPQTRA